MRLALASKMSNTTMTKVEFYDKFMRELYWRDLRFINWRVEEIKKLVNRFVPKGSKVLEVGCGNGLITRHLAKRARSVLALDISSTAIENARKYVRRSNCTLRVANIICDNIAGIYDVIVLADVIEHIENHNRRWLLHQLELRLAFDGLLILCWPNPEAQKESNQIVEEPVDIKDILALTSLKLLYLSHVNADGKNKYIHCVLKKRIPFVPQKRTFLVRLKDFVKKIWRRFTNIRLIW